MSRLQRATVEEWLHLELDGALPPESRAVLEREVARDPELARERDELARLDSMLSEATIPVRDDFQAEVLAALPEAGWQGRHPRTWRMAVALLVFLGGASAALLGIGSSRLTPAGPLAGAAVAVADLFKAALVAGGGLLAASWKGTGMVLSAALDGSPVGIALLSVFVLTLNLLLYRLVQSRRHAAARATAESARGSSD